MTHRYINKIVRKLTDFDYKILIVQMWILTMLNFQII